MTPPPENRSPTGEAVASPAFRSLLPGPDLHPVHQRGVELVGVGGPPGPQPAGEPYGTRGPPHSSGTSGKPPQTGRPPASVRQFGPRASGRAAPRVRRTAWVALPCR
jgi:hypothetical protein